MYLDKEIKADFPECIWERQQLPNSYHLSIIYQRKDLPFCFIAAQSLLEPLVRNHTQCFMKFSHISLSTHLMTAPRHCNMVAKKDSPSKKNSLATCSNFSIVIQMQNIQSSFLQFPILALFPLTIPFMSLLLSLQALWPAFSTWRACRRIY